MKNKVQSERKIINTRKFFLAALVVCGGIFFSKSIFPSDVSVLAIVHAEDTNLIGEQFLNGKWYHFDEETGEMTTGWYDFPDKRVYYASSGEMVYGLQKVEGKTYYFDVNTGKVSYGERNISGKWYYFDEKTGVMVSGWHDFEDKRVVYAATGEMLFGKQRIEGNTYYLNPNSGGLVTGEINIGGQWHYFDSEGKMVTGWHDFPNKRVYYASTGEMLFGKHQIGDFNYYFDEMSGKNVGGEKYIAGKWYHFDEVTGIMTIGWYDYPDKRVYYAVTGEMLFGKQIIEGNTYYLDVRKGGLASGEQYILNKWYNFDNNGKMITGWYDFENKKVFYKSTGEMVTGEWCIENKWYYFSPSNGAMMVGWIHLPEKWVYYNSDGSMYYGKLLSDGKEYYLQPETGKMTIGLCSFGDETFGYGKDGAKVYGEYSFDGKWYFFDKNTGVMQRGWYDLPGKRVFYMNSGEMAFGKQDIGGSTYYFNTSTGALVKKSWEKIENMWYYFKEDGTLDIIRKPQKDFIGTCKAKIIEELESHENDQYYIGTPYRGLNLHAPNYEEIMYPNGAPRWDGYRGFNCTGFVAFVMRKCGADLRRITEQGGSGAYCNAMNWRKYAQKNVKCYGFSSVKDLLASKKAEKGDLIYCEPNWNWPGADCHIGIFWGNSSTDNRFWHQPYPKNVISNIFSGTRVQTYYIIKTS